MEKLYLMSTSLALDDTGIYPQSWTDENGVNTKRTEWQNGWNACALATRKKTTILYQFLKTLPESCLTLIEYDKIDVCVQDKKAFLLVNCNDLFYWACSDTEEFELSDIPDLEKALIESPNFGELLWCCRKRGMRPQKPYYKSFTENDAKLFNECGPERNE